MLSLVPASVIISCPCYANLSLKRALDGDTSWYSCEYLLLTPPPNSQFPNPVRVPAFTAAIREDGNLLSKTIIPIPIQALAASTPTPNPLTVSQHGITEPDLPIRAATLTPGQSMHLSFE